MVGTSAGDGLNAGNAFVRNRGGVITQDKAGSSGGEFRKTSNREVFMVDGGIVQQNLSSLAANGIGTNKSPHDCK